MHCNLHHIECTTSVSETIRKAPFAEGQTALLKQKYAKFHWNRAIGCWVMAKRFSIWRPSAILNLKIFIFGHVTVNEFQICICVPNFTKIGWVMPCEAMQAARGLCRHAVSVRPSVCLSHSWILSKWGIVSSKFLHNRVAKPKPHVYRDNVSPLRGDKPIFAMDHWLNEISACLRCAQACR